MSLRVRKQKGSQLVEFVAALSVFLLFILLPLANLSVLPIRFMLANELVKNESRRLSYCETLSQSAVSLHHAPSLEERLCRIGGVAVDNIDLHLRIERQPGQPNAGGKQVIEIRQPGGQVPADWLPDNKKGQCTYCLVLTCRLLMSPAVVLDGLGFSIPGLSGPLPLTVTAVRDWGNLGKNPTSGKYFFNE